LENLTKPPTAVKAFSKGIASSDRPDGIQSAIVMKARVALSIKFLAARAIGNPPLKSRLCVCCFIDLISV
jgi:hypothetical protein